MMHAPIRRGAMAVGMVVAGLLLVAVPASADHTVVLRGFDAATNYGDTVTLKAQLVEPNFDCGGSFCPVSNRQVDFYVDGSFVGTDLTNSGGFALLNTSSPTWHVGAHAIRAQYDRSSNPATPAIATSTLTISQEITAVAAHKGYFQAQLLDDDNLPLSGFAVRFHVSTPNGEQNVCTAFTDAAGTARCVPVTGAGLSPLNQPETTYTATFDGTADYAGSSGSATLI